MFMIKWQSGFEIQTRLSQLRTNAHWESYVYTLLPTFVFYFIQALWRTETNVNGVKPRDCENCVGEGVFHSVYQSQSESTLFFPFSIVQCIQILFWHNEESFQVSIECITHHIASH